MTDFVKMLIGEKNGIELDDTSEWPFTGALTFLQSSEFVSDNVQGALEDLVLRVLAQQSLRRVFRNVTIPDAFQMVVYQEFCVDLGVELNIEGEVAVL